MDGVHDLGGKDGFGPVRWQADEDGAPFHADWEARAWGIFYSAGGHPSWTIDWTRHVRERIEPSVYLATPYFDHWIWTMMAMLIDDGIADIVTGSEVGLCQSEIESCVEGEMDVIQMGVGPVLEVCDDGLDQDCDGGDCVTLAVSILAPASGLLTNAALTVPGATRRGQTIRSGTRVPPSYSVDLPPRSGALLVAGLPSTRSNVFPPLSELTTTSVSSASPRASSSSRRRPRLASML